MKDNFGQTCISIRLANFYSSFQKSWFKNNAELFFFKIHYKEILDPVQHSLHTSLNLSHSSQELRFAFKSQQVALETASSLFSVKWFWKLNRNIVTQSRISWKVVRGHRLHTHTCSWVSQQITECQFQSGQGWTRCMNQLCSYLSFP